VNNDPINWRDLWGLNPFFAYNMIDSEGSGGRRTRGLDLNLVYPNDPAYGNIHRAPHPPNTIVVATHADPSGFIPYDKDLRSYLGASPAEIADLIRILPNYTQDKIIILLSCEAGKSPAPGINSPAQDLANILGNTVLAPDTPTTITQFGNVLTGEGQNGELKDGDPGVIKSGDYSEYKTFTPCKG
jgi:hypothetical protein